MFAKPNKSLDSVYQSRINKLSLLMMFQEKYFMSKLLTCYPEMIYHCNKSLCTGVN